MQTHIPLATYIPQPSFASLLAGIEDIIPYRTAARAEYLFVAPAQLDRVGPLSYNAQYFGFQPIEQTLWALPVDDTIQETVLELVPVTNALGSIDVRFFGVAEGLEGDLYRQGGIGEVVLIAAGGERLSYGIRAFHESCILTDIPFGEYQGFFYCYSTSFRYPEKDFHSMTVGETPTEFLVDMTASGALELVPHKRDKSPYFGPLSSYIMSGDSTNASEAHRGGPALFERPPFIISGIQPGRYSIFVMNPLPVPGGESVRVVEITSGQTTQLELELAD